MDLKNNPFYILELPCCAKHGQIYEAVDRLSLWDVKNQVESAQNALLNPSSRIAAEIDWFPALDQNLLENVRSCIAKDQPITITSDDSLTSLNILLHNTALSIKQFDFGKPQPIKQLNLLYQQIIDISNAFQSATETKVFHRLCACHRIAGIPDPSKSDVSSQLLEKRGEIVRLLTSKLVLLSENEYIQVMVRLSETLQQSYGEIIAGLVDQYELHMHDAALEQASKIYTMISELKRIDDSKERDLKTITLIKNVELWNTRIRPASVKAFANGMSYPPEKKLGIALTQLAVYFYNKKRDISASSYLLENIRTFFERESFVTAEIDSLIKQIKTIKGSFQPEPQPFPPRPEPQPVPPKSFKKLHSRSSGITGFEIVLAIVVLLLVLSSISNSCSNSSSAYNNHNSGTGYSNPIPTVYHPRNTYSRPTMNPAYLMPPSWNSNPTFSIPTLDPNLKLPQINLPEDFDYEMYFDSEP